MTKKHKTTINAKHVQVGETLKQIVWNGAGQGGVVAQLKRAGDTITQTMQKWPWHVIPPGKTIKRMAPVLSKKCTKTNNIPKKCQLGRSVSLSSTLFHHNLWFTKLQIPCIEQLVFHNTQDSSQLKFKSAKAQQAPNLLSVMIHSFPTHYVLLLSFSHVHHFHPASTHSLGTPST